MSSIFWDPIDPTIDDAYRRYYGLGMAVVFFVSIFVTAVVSGVVVHCPWSGLGLVAPQGRAGGTAPSGYTVSLDAAFTLVFLGQIHVGQRATNGEPATDHDMHTG